MSFNVAKDKLTQLILVKRSAVRRFSAEFSGQGIGMALLKVFADVVPVGMRISARMANVISQEQLRRAIYVDALGQVRRRGDGLKVVNHAVSGDPTSVSLDQVLKVNFVRPDADQGWIRTTGNEWTCRGIETTI